MPKRMKHSELSIRSRARNSTTPSSSDLPPVSLSENKERPAKGTKRAFFPFLALPSELRNKIYSMVFCPIPQVLDLDPSTFQLLHKDKTLALFAVSRQVHIEASHYFFSTNTFRLFPTYPGRYFKTKRPLLARLPSRYRSALTNLELRLGPGWNAPPPGWVVNEALGLKDCTNVRVLKVFVECDPSDAIYAGFRRSDGFFKRFSQNLLEDVLKGIPGIKVVELDAWVAVKTSGDMIAGLKDVALKFEKVIGWGPEGRWDQEVDTARRYDMPIHGDEKLSKSDVILAWA